MTDTITSFDGEYRFLSNFWQCMILFEDHFYSSAEQIYVTYKLKDKSSRDLVRAIHDPGKAKRFGRIHTMREDWDDIKYATMYNIVKAKFDQNPNLMEMLIATKPKIIIGGNTWGDRYWGQCPLGTGENNLGKILMTVRDSII